MELRIGVPSGIGDISWIVSKLVNTNGYKFIVEIADGWPYRAEEYIKLLGEKFEFGGYGDFEYRDIVGFEKINPYQTFRDIVEAGYGRYLIQNNHHLERGLPLKEWLPDLLTNYHYTLHTSSSDEAVATTLLKHVPRPRVGLSAASYRGAVAWKTWEGDKWRELIKVMESAGYSVVLMGGGWDDLTRSLANAGKKVYSVVGQTSFGEAVAMHKLLDGYVGFSSGLGIIRTVLGLPTYMLWPSHQMALSSSWADPMDLATERYIATGYIDVDGVWGLLQYQLKKFEKEVSDE